MKVNDMNNDKVIKIGVIGATGYTGIELLRLLAAHPNAQVKVITSREHTGIRVDSLFPALRGFYDHHFVEPNSEHLYECDVVFFATEENKESHLFTLVNLVMDKDQVC